jgi:hypothetical protein
MIRPLPGQTPDGETAMRAFAVATILLFSTCLVPAFAEEPGQAPGSSQPQAGPEQPERTPQQSDQSRAQERQRAGDVGIGRDWKAQERNAGPTDRMDKNNMGRMSDDQDREHRTVGRGWRMHRDDDDRADEDRPRRRTKICYEYENGDEYCRYRN